MLKGGVLKFLSGVLVVMKGNIKGNLYFLQGCTVIGSFFVSIEEKEGPTRLWHMIRSCWVEGDDGAEEIGY